ncbi:MAG: hypothetical protein ACYTGL_02645 [Planctomycetota bacterium]|jgi:hypothetical protein
MPIACRVLVLATFVVCFSRMANAASVASPNFHVTADSESLARQVAAAAEFHRRKLARLWYGHELPDWAVRCSIDVDASPNKGAGGSTSFKFSSGEVYGWRMRVQGSVERIIDSVIPHEVNHTILACYFRRKVPRWADEGAATIFEHTSERQRQIDEVQRLMHNGRRIPLRVLMSMTQYPSDMRQVMAMYAQSYALTDYLIQKGGRKTFLTFLNDAHRRGWDAALQTHYEQKSIEHLEQDWTGWVMAGFPRLNLPPGQLLAKTTDSNGIIVRGQSPDPADPPTEAVRSAFRELPVPSLKPTAKIATQLRASWQNTATAFSRVRSFGRKLAGQSGEDVQPVELTPVEGTPAPPPEAEELRALELIPVDPSQSSRGRNEPHRHFVGAEGRHFASENPFVKGKVSGLSRLDRQTARQPTPLRSTGLKETRLHREPAPQRRSESLSDWGRFPTRLR